MKVPTAAQTLLGDHALIDPLVDLRKVRLHTGGPVGWYLRLLGRAGVTVGHHVFFVDARARQSLPLLAHELVHVAQFRELGFFRFLLRYWRDMARAGFRYSRKLPLEAPAYARQREAEERLGLR